VPLDLLPRTLVCAISAWVVLYAPGRALVRTGFTTIPTAFARVLASVIVTTITGTGLAAAASFSLPALIAANAVVAAVFLLLRERIAGAPAELWRNNDRPRELAGPLLFALALASYWPAYPAFLGASDSTAYLSSGISLAHHGTLGRTDEIGPTLPKGTREVLFDTMSQVFASTGPPYRRMPGAMLLESLDSTQAWPCFFPVPSVWAAIFVVVGAPGGDSAEQAAPGFAPLFAALALWSFWLLARCWLGPRWGLFAVVLLAASGPFYFSARLPLSEPIAAYFALSGLAILSMRAAAERAPSPSSAGQVFADGAGLSRLDAILAGAAFGTAVFTRVEIALLLVMTFALIPTLAHSRSARADFSNGWAFGLPRVFFAALLATASLTVAQALLLPGSYISPLFDHLQNAWIRYILRYGYPTAGLLAAAAGAGGLVLLAGSRTVGLSATLRWGFLLAVWIGHWGASSYLAERTPMWLSFYVGWFGLALAVVGAYLAWRERARLPAAPFVLALAAATASILFYNPHVFPSLPWGARRFVPLLLPLLVLLACHTCARLATRSRLASAACAAAVGFFVAAGGRPVWGEKLMEGAWSQLQAISAAIPEGGTILIDREVSPMMVGPALWLILDRNGLSVPPTNSAAGREILPHLAWELAGRAPVYFVTRGTGNQVRTEKVVMELLARETASLRLLEQTYDRRPERIQRYIMPISIYRMHRSLDPRGLISNTIATKPVVASPGASPHAAPEKTAPVPAPAAP